MDSTRYNSPKRLEGLAKWWIVPEQIVEIHVSVPVGLRVEDPVVWILTVKPQHIIRLTTGVRCWRWVRDDFRDPPVTGPSGLTTVSTTSIIWWYYSIQLFRSLLSVKPLTSSVMVGSDKIHYRSEDLRNITKFLTWNVHSILTRLCLKDQHPLCQQTLFIKIKIGINLKPLWLWTTTTQLLKTSFNLTSFFVISQTHLHTCSFSDWLLITVRTQVPHNVPSGYSGVSTVPVHC